MSILLAEINWNELVEPERLTVAFLFGGGFIVAIVSIVAGCLVTARRHSENTKLKQEMLERGLSADEMVKILNAGDEKKT